MDNKIFCGQCGTENPTENNFCFKCGQKLTRVSEGFTEIDNNTTTNNEYVDIKKALQRLINTNGFTIISIGDYYVQFSNDLSKHELNFEAVSSVYLASVGNKDKEFKQLGFKNAPDSNYYKSISHTGFSAEQTVDEIKTIFVTIYNLPFSSYIIENDFEDEPIIQTDKSTQNTLNKNNQNQKNNYGCLVIILIAVVILIYGAMSGNSEKSSSDNTEVVSNSGFDASVYQVERYLKREYLKAPDSYQGIEWSKVQKDNSNSIYKYYVRHKFRAKNGFGGYVVEEKIFYLDQSGNVVNVQDY